MKESLRLEEVSPRGAYARGSFLITIERGEQALPFLRRTRDAYPGSPSVHTALARACLIRKNWIEAGAAVREALRLGGEKAPLLLIMAYLYSIDGRWAESIEAAEEALRFDSNLWGGYEILGDAYLETDREERALRAYLKEAELRSDPELAVKLADLYFNRKAYDSAARWYEKVIPDYPAYPRSRVYLAGCYAHQEEYARSRALYREAAEKFPGFSQICFFNLARISLREGKEEEARSWLKKIDDPRLREKIESDDSLSRIIRE